MENLCVVNKSEKNHLNPSLMTYKVFLCIILIFECFLNMHCIDKLNDD